MFLEVLETLMEANGLNLNQLSKLSKIPYMTLKNFWVKGYENTKLSTLKQLAKYFNVSLDYLVFGQDYVYFNENDVLKKHKSNITIGERIKERRKELGLSIDDVAAALGKDRSTIYRYESNEIEKLPTTILQPLAQILQTTPEHLMGWSIPEQKNVKPSILIKYNKLNPTGQQKADAYIDDLLDNPKYTVNKEVSKSSAPERTLEDYGEIAAEGGATTRGANAEDCEIL